MKAIPAEMSSATGQAIVQKADEGGKCRRLAHRLGGAAEEMERQEHQPDADQRRAAALAGGRVAEIEHDAGEDDQRRQPLDMSMATIQAVTAVPTFAPSRTIVLRGLTSSRSTKQATISAVAVELCSATMATKPEKKERRALRVPVARRFGAWRRRPATRRPSPERWPNSSKAMAPNRFIMTIVDPTLCSVLTGLRKSSRAGHGNHLGKAIGRV